MSINAIESVGFTPYVPPTVQAAPASDGVDFAAKITEGLDQLSAVQQNSETLAVAAATGRLENIHDYTLAATEAATMTQLTVAVRNKAVEAFNEIMRMPV